LLRQFVVGLIGALPRTGRKYFLIGCYLTVNWVARLKAHSRTPWVCCLPNDPTKKLDYVNQVYSDYFELSRLPISLVRGKKILEIGPGENLGVGIRFLSDGADLVVSVDRFRSLASKAEQAQVYAGLLAEMSAVQRNTLGNSVVLTTDDFKIDNDKYHYLADTPVEEISRTIPSQSFDMIVSRAVLEHVSDLEGAFQSMDAVLNPGGYMIHEVDFRDHGIFSNHNLNPLTFLTVSDSLWKAMTSHIGAPNRKFIDSYIHLLEQYGYFFRISRILALGSDRRLDRDQLQPGIDYSQETIDLIAEVRKKVISQFRRLTNAELLVTGIFITARKTQPDSCPSGSGAGRSSAK